MLKFMEPYMVAHAMDKVLMLRDELVKAGVLEEREIKGDIKKQYKKAKSRKEQADEVEHRYWISKWAEDMVALGLTKSDTAIARAFVNIIKRREGNI